ncbi:uncharacterized protein FFMR_12183 [Fusarium fujikuroi]|nr:uncharacterized protein FFM5_13391 [Fusarium fujikuroi]SCO55012.1 uncharacterized protein FFMR_12183 [Fusarium fujikuroi]
MPFNLPFKISI